MKSKEQLIDEIEEKNRILYKMISIRELEKLLKETEKSIEKVNKLKELLNKLDDNEEE